ncbi:MAG: sensor histidine kinase [Chloroflexi bacterium]|nr:MAG: sensor histidine kinase [Chloroflexota bacterium]
MTNPRLEMPEQHEYLARWLQDHLDMLGRGEEGEHAALHQALYEGVITLTGQGDARLLDSVLENAAAQAVAAGQGLENLLAVPLSLAQRIRQRILEEIDPEPALEMLAVLDKIFDRAVIVVSRAYQEAYQLAYVDRAVEISRFYAETEEKVMQYAAEVARANRELARLEKAKTDFINIAAHELKTPLTLIRGYINMLQHQEPDSPLIPLVEGIARGAERMNTIIENMLDLSALDTGQLQLVLTPVNLQSLLQLIADQQKPALDERQQTLKIGDLSGLPVIEADQGRLHQVFTHLVKNAIKYTPDGGVISISGSVQTENESGNYVHLLVRDTGVGIAPEEREKIFARFHRVGDSNLHSTGETKFMGAGPGLGLAIVKGLVEAHGGRVWADSPGFDFRNCPGSTFHVVLPVVPPQSEVRRVRPFHHEHEHEGQHERHEGHETAET